MRERGTQHLPRPDAGDSVTSIDFHVTFDESAQEVSWNPWNADGIGADIPATD
jgi:hypothetical protein